jgi:hypothetical protein
MQQSTDNNMFCNFFNSPSANRTPCFFLENSLCARIATSLMRNLSVNKRGILDSPVADGAERGRRLRSGRRRRRICFVRFFFCSCRCCCRRRRCFCHRLCHACKNFVCVVFVVVVVNVVVVVVVVFVTVFCFFIFLFFFILLFSFPAGFVSVGNPIFPVLPIKNKNSAAVADLS